MLFSRKILFILFIQSPLTASYTVNVAIEKVEAADISSVIGIIKNSLPGYVINYDVVTEQSYWGSLFKSSRKHSSLGRSAFTLVGSLFGGSIFSYLSILYIIYKAYKFIKIISAFIPRNEKDEDQEVINNEVDEAIEDTEEDLMLNMAKILSRNSAQVRSYEKLQRLEQFLRMYKKISNILISLKIRHLFPYENELEDKLDDSLRFIKKTRNRKLI